MSGLIERSVDVDEALVRHAVEDSSVAVVAGLALPGIGSEAGTGVAGVGGGRRGGLTVPVPVQVIAGGRASDIGVVFRGAVDHDGSMAPTGRVGEAHGVRGSRVEVRVAAAGVAFVADVVLVAGAVGSLEVERRRGADPLRGRVRQRGILRGGPLEAGGSIIAPGTLTARVGGLLPLAILSGLNP